MIFTDLFPPWPLLSTFILASLILALTPGPGVLFIVTRSITHGRRSGLITVAGIELGNLGNAVSASLGLAALFAISSLAFTLVKYAGAAYLIYLGWKMFHSSPVAITAVAPANVRSAHIFRDGFFVALLNPKTTMFYAAFLPQFLNPASPAPAVYQSLALALLFVVIATLTDVIYALVAGTAAPVLRNRATPRLALRLGGGMFIGLGIFTALAGTRPGK